MDITLPEFSVSIQYKCSLISTNDLEALQPDHILYSNLFPSDAETLAASSSSLSCLISGFFKPSQISFGLFSLTSLEDCSRTNICTKCQWFCATHSSSLTFSFLGLRFQPIWQFPFCTPQPHAEVGHHSLSSNKLIGVSVHHFSKTGQGDLIFRFWILTNLD